MSRDQMQDVFPIDINFKKGEQVTATKLTGQARQIDTAFARVTQAVGDPWEYSVHSKGESEYFLSPERLAQASLSRMIGPSDYNSIAGASFNESSASVVILKVGKNSWNLGFPLVYSSGTQASPDSDVDDLVVEMPYGPPDGFSILNSEGLFLEANLKTTIQEVSQVGDWHVDRYKGTITTYSPTTQSATLFINKISMLPAGIPWGSANVIPTWRQTNTLCAVTYIEEVAGIEKYTLALPIVTQQPRVVGDDMLGGNHPRITVGENVSELADAIFTGMNAPGSATGGSTTKYRLPYSITDDAVDLENEQLPEGFCLLWDDSLDKIVQQVTFFYIDEHTLELHTPKGTTGRWLTEVSDKYRLIITGSSLAETVGYLASVVRDNRHIGLTDGSTTRGTFAYTAPLSHADMDDLHTGDFGNYISSLQTQELKDEYTLRFSFSKSDFPTNDHSQYLHRGGYLSDDGNTDNAMRGHLVFSSAYDPLIPDKGFQTGVSTTTGLSSSTFGIGFGHSTGAPTITFEGGEHTPGWTAGNPSNRYAYSILATGATGTALDSYKGAVVYTPSIVARPLHLSGWAGGSVQAQEQRGACLGFDLGLNHEMNYIKLMPASRDTTGNGLDQRNIAAFTSQFGFTTRLDINPDLPNTLSPSQIREFRFRGVSYVEDANPAYPGIGTGDQEKYFTSPGMVGADFLNLYSNAIFFSEQGDGKWTSFTEQGEAWLNNGFDFFGPTIEQQRPTGLYYVPDGHELQFTYQDAAVRPGFDGKTPFKTGEKTAIQSWATGPDTILLESNNSTEGDSIHVESLLGGVYIKGDENSPTAPGIRLQSGNVNSLYLHDAGINIAATRSVWVYAGGDENAFSEQGINLMSGENFANPHGGYRTSVSESDGPNGNDRLALHSDYDQFMWSWQGGISIVAGKSTAVIVGETVVNTVDMPSRIGNEAPWFNPASGDINLDAKQDIFIDSGRNVTISADNYVYITSVNTPDPPPSLQNNDMKIYAGNYLFIGAADAIQITDGVDSGTASGTTWTLHMNSSGKLFKTQDS